MTARTMNPTSHTRLPRYARGKRNVVHRWHGAHVFADVPNALEQLILEKSLATPDALAARKEAWRAAYARTLHGQPVLLD